MSTAFETAKTDFLNTLPLTYVVMGVCGSGKTAIGQKFAESIGWEFVEGDDLHPKANKEKMAAGNPLTDEDRMPWLDALGEVIRSKDQVVLSCSALRKKYRDRLRSFGIIEFIYLEGEKKIIAERLATRSHEFMNPELLDSQFAVLEEPERCVRVKIEGAIEVVVRDILSGISEPASVTQSLLLDEENIAELADAYEKFPRERPRNERLEKFYDLIQADSLTSETLRNLVSLLSKEEALTIQTTTQTTPLGDLRVTRAANTDMWPMGTHYWTRDNILVSDRLIRNDLSKLGGESNSAMGRELLLSTLKIMSSPSQLAKFRAIALKEVPFTASNWPQIFLGIKDNLDGSDTEGWMHIQDAWQMVVVVTLRLVREGFLSHQDIPDSAWQMFSYVLPFLESIGSPNYENAGSWEELVSKRSSVLCWEFDVCRELQDASKEAHDKILPYLFELEGSKQETTYPLWQARIQSLQEKILNEIDRAFPFESPDYESTDPRYREADSALLYFFQTSTLSALSKRRGVSLESLEDQLLQQIKSVIDPLSGALRRYLGDSYQGQSYFRFRTQEQLRNYSAGPSGDFSAASEFVARGRVVPAGREAAWTHFVWQLVSWAGERYLETGSDKYREIMNRHFLTGIALITGNGEKSIDSDAEGVFRVIPIPSFRIPEAYISEKDALGNTLLFPSPHTPLNWAVGEAVRALRVVGDVVMQGGE